MSVFMIDLSSWPADFKIAALLIPFLITLTGVGIHIHIASSKHFDVMCAALQRSQCLHEELRRGGAFNFKLRTMTVSAITGVLFWPELSVRREYLDSEDYRAFPRYLRKRMKAAMICMVFGMSCMAFIVLFVNFERA